MMDFADKVVVVSGGMGGIGLEICELFGAAGARVVAVDRRKDKDGSVEGGFRQRGLDVRFRAVDVTSALQVSTLGQHIRMQYGRADVLINNAGILSFAPILGADANEWDRVQKVNCKSAFLMIRAIAPLMQGQGAIVNVSSSAAQKPTANTAAYSIAKAGLLTLTQIAALELGPGIRVNAICPGPLDTDMPHNYLRGHPMKDQIMREMIDRTVVKRLGHPKEIAKAIAFLAGDAASYVTGAVLSADGGFMN
ncbi:SDR family NAD(P)-dependent oxidoreductase [Niveispirillum sp.]|uniref:SDR family NAD(P)-dependent oxidoreductase n=1 Tax=Niveispirillum sp. TaxID=1917217 RepID=UPI001B435CD5|nr:SDR family oxidoreductase [Niveispirillum sp.]MBP7337927.1 SDR family oxidoreductase [Niveispirillum sp.]